VDEEMKQRCFSTLTTPKKFIHFGFTKIGINKLNPNLLIDREKFKADRKQY